MSLNTSRPAPVDVTKNNPNDVLLVRGKKDGSPEAWRLIVSSPFDTLSVQHFEPLTEAGITLDEAHVTSIEGNSIYTSQNPYFASVTTDSRVDNTTPAGISGDMTGRVIEWDGFIWGSSADQYFEKASFAESLFSDRGVFQRMTVIRTDPNDPRKHPPTPVQGTSIGSRNTQADGNGIEILSFNDQFGHFGQMVEMLHGPDADLINQLKCIKVDNTLLGIPYELAWKSGTNYAVDDIIVDVGVRFKANVAGVQTVSFASNASKWDAINYEDVFDVDTILTSNGDVLVAGGNVLVVSP